MSKLKKLKHVNQDKMSQTPTTERSNYHSSFRTAVYNLEQYVMDEKVPILRKLA